MSEDMLGRAISLYGNSLFRYAVLYLGNRHNAEDACQETYIRYYLYIKKHGEKAYADTKHEQAWLYRVLTNICKNMLNSWWNRKTDAVEEEIFHEQTGGNVEEEAMRKQEEGMLLSFVNKLTKPLKEVVLLYYYSGFSTSEISEMLKIPKGTVRSRLDSARNKLQVLMKEAGYDAEQIMIG